MSSLASLPCVLVAVWAQLAYSNDILHNINEFTLIKKYLSDIGTSYASHISTNVGDDCAVYSSPSQQLITTDVAVAEVHFPKSLPSEFIARRAVAAAFSDIAAMGGSITGFTLGLSLERVNADWLAGLRKGLKFIAKQYQVPLIGGDVVKGPTQLAITVIGRAAQKPILRSGAKTGDIICLSGKLGRSYLGFRAYQKDKQLNAITRGYLSPEAKVTYGQCCAKDLSHLMGASKVGANVDFKSIPFASDKDIPKIIGFGDDYELLFTVSPNKIKPLRASLAKNNMGLWEIGVVDGKKIKIDNLPKKISSLGWDHFA
ncbi:MAG: thiamine-phosphate kinase [Proteobacteria bacterium]|nr:thiamine-phosphate kinase [Pseudomonadota bacterium]